MINMSAIHKTVTFTEQQYKWIKAQMEAGDYTNDSEYIRNLVRQDPINNSEFLSLKTKLIDALENCVSSKSLPNILKGVEAGMQEDGRL